MGVKALRKIQLGNESVAGTAVAADTVWRGMGTIQDNREVVFAEEDVGYLSGVDRTYIPKLEAAITFEPVDCTFEQFPHILEAGVLAVGSGTADGAGTDYIYEYTFPTTSANAIRTYTIEGGDDVQAEEMEYSFVSAFTLSGTGGEALMMSADWIGRQVTQSTFTAAQSAPAVSTALFGGTKLYIDSATATIGTTQITQSLLEFEMNVTTGWIPVYTADGNTYFEFNKNVGPEVLLRLVFEHSATAVGEKVTWRAETAQQIRLEVTGPAVGTPGTTYSNKMIIIDLAGKHESIERLGDRDGNDVFEVLFRARYNSDAALFALITIVNELAAVP